jgi:hypothetical protein
MVARAWGERVESKKLRPATRKVDTRGRGAIEEQFVRNEAVSVCLLINRRTRTMRVIDFRAGPSHAKRLFVLDFARKNGVEKVYTLVERDELSTWVKLGFAKEATIPGFYKRSDAFLLGTGVDDAAVKESDLRASLEGRGEDDDVHPEAPTPAHDRMEKTLQHAKRQAKGLLDRDLPPTKLAQVKESDVQKPLEKALRAGDALTAFEPFGRDVERRWFQLTARGGFELFASTETQGCFGNAFIELLTSPATEHERLATASALRTLCERLLAEGVVSGFALTPSDDLALATAFAFNGFRRTGLLLGHMVAGGKRKDAIVWSRKLANPAES